MTALDGFDRPAVISKVVETDIQRPRWACLDRPLVHHASE
jgi:hypothetical protein